MSQSLTSRSRAIVATPQASRYLQQLCKHWNHKFDVTFDTATGHIPLPFGDVDLVADDIALHITCQVPAGGDLARIEEVVAVHLNRFAFREGELVFNWQSL